LGTNLPAALVQEQSFFDPSAKLSQGTSQWAVRVAQAGHSGTALAVNRLRMLTPHRLPTETLVVLACAGSP
jgi:hypothetical protein